MESDDDYELLPSSPVHERKLKRLKKAIRVSDDSRPKTPDGGPSTPPTNSSDFGILHSNSSDAPDLEESNVGSVPGFESFGFDNGLRSKLGSTNADEIGLDAVRILEFDSVAKEFDGEGEACSIDMGKEEEFGDLKADELVKKRPSLDSFAEKKEKKKKRVGSDGAKKKGEESASDKRRAEKERRANLEHLRAESQRLLREARDAEFKPIPLVQKPISLVLGKIRRRKSEVLKKCCTSIDDSDGLIKEVMEDGNPKHDCPNEEIIEKVEQAERQEAVTCLAEIKYLDESHNAANYSSHETIPSPEALCSVSEHAFRAPIDDTQDLFLDSQRSDAEDEAINENPNSPLQEDFAPSMLGMNLKLDSAPTEDVSSDEEDNDKENIDPHPHGSADLSSPPSGDPVRAFVDEEAEEEDDSDNDMRFQDNEDEDEDLDDVEELNNMIGTEYEEKPIDRERRDQLHQQWLEQQDEAGMDNLLQKLNCGSKFKKSTSIEEEDEQGKDTENESYDEAEEYVAPSDAVRMNLKKIKQMIPQMFTDKDDAYVSSDDEETGKRLAKQCLFDKTEEQATFLSPAEDESSREVFSLIKKLNIVPDTKRKGRTPSFLDASLIGQNISTSSKSSFLGRASNHSMNSSQKNGSSKVRSFIFERDDSNSKTSIFVSEDSIDTVERESQPSKVGCVKSKSNTQNKQSTLNSASQSSGTSLIEILRRSSLHTEQRVQNTMVRQTESVFAAFKLAKTIKTEGRM